MSRLNQRLSQLRKQSGGQIESARALLTKSLLSNESSDQQELTKETIFSTLKMGRSSFSNQSRSKEQRINDAEIALKLNGKVYQAGLVFIRRVFSLKNIHESYDSRFLNPLLNIVNNAFPQKFLFIDTDTTGLSTAAGTRVFLLGTGEVIGDEFVLEQMLLTRVAAEADMLKWFEDKCADKTHLVSYNGKSFDVPLMTTRFRMNRLTENMSNLGHVDLLHWIRRLHQKQIPDCRLPSAEKHCLNFYRKDDLPGSEAPIVWQNFIRFGDDAKLKPLVQHHAWDILSLVGLLHYVESTLAQEKKGSFDYYCVANYFWHKKQSEKAISLLESNFNCLNANAKFLLSKLYRQQKQWKKAVDIWKTLQQQNYLPAIECLAKFYEHRAKNYERALFFTRQLIEKDNINCHEHRYHRIKNKAEKLLSK